jgi:ABC-type nitrate/sulfonate/bicarbonate transport system substrate-binding protein
MGTYKKYQIDVALTYTHSSTEQRNGLANNTYDLAHSAVDNAVAMVDVALEDVCIVIGLDQAFNKLVTIPTISTYDDLRGKRLGVDATDTAFALVAYEMLRLNGILEGDYSVVPIGATGYRLEAIKKGEIDFTMLNLPFNLFAKDAGLKLFDDPSRLIGEYQSTGGFVKRDWAVHNSDLLCSYLAAYIEAVRCILNPLNKNLSIRLMKQNLNLANETASLCYDQITAPNSGFVKDAEFSLLGMQKVLGLRAGFNRVKLDKNSNEYYDDSFYSKALKLF